MAQVTRETDANWSLDKRIPIALIMTICLGAFTETTVGIWAASNLWTRVDALEKTVAEQRPQQAQIRVLETKIDALADTVHSIKTALLKGN